MMILKKKIHQLVDKLNRCEKRIYLDFCRIYQFIADASVVELKDSIINFVNELLNGWGRKRLEEISVFWLDFVIFIIRMMDDVIGNWELGEQNKKIAIHKQNKTRIRRISAANSEHLFVG